MDKINWINGQAGGTPLSAENLNLMQDNIENAINAIKEIVFPIGSTYITQTNTNPNTILGFGTWERLKGKVIVGLDEDDSDFDSIGKTGGTKAHKHLMPFIVDNPLNWGRFQWNLSSQLNGHERVVSPDSNCINNTATGEEFNGYRLYSGDGSSLQPYEVVGYMWIRRD